MTDAPDPTDAAEYNGLFMAHRHFEDEWSISTCYATRQEAIDAYGPDDGVPDGEHFRTAQLSYVRQAPPCPYDGADFGDALTNNANDEWSEGAVERLNDQWSDEVSAKFGAKLEALWEAFCEEQGLVLDGYFTRDVEHHVVGEDESEGELNIRRAEARLEEIDEILKSATHAPTIATLRAETEALKVSSPDGYARATAYNPAMVCRFKGITQTRAEELYKEMCDEERP